MEPTLTLPSRKAGGRGRWLLVLLFGSLSAGFFLLSMYWPEKPEPRAARAKVYLIGLDGASWNLINPLLEQGKLPHFRRLMERGSYGPLKTFKPTISPILWTTIATGKTYEKHGIGNFTAEMNGKRVPISSMVRATKAYWNILSDYGIRVGVVNWWVTWPPDKINGFIVSDRFREKKYKNQHDLTYPPELADQLPAIRMSDAQFARERQKYGLPENMHPAASSPAIENLVSHYKGFWVQDKLVRETSAQLLQTKDVDVFGVVFRIVDVSSHLFWMYLDLDLIKEMRAKNASGAHLSEPDRSRIDAAYAKALEPVYKYADQILGDFMKVAGPDPTIIVCSDHGFKFDDGRYGHNDLDLPPDGVVILSGPQFRPGFQIRNASLYDITPTLLYLEGIPTGRDMDGRPLFSAIKPEFLNGHPVTVVASHDKGFRQKGKPASSDMDKDMLEELKSLGYIQ